MKRVEPISVTVLFSLLIVTLPVSRLQRVKVKIPQNSSQKGKNSRRKGAVVLERCPKQQITQLGVREKDHEKHDPEAGYVAAATVQGGGQLGHRFVEGDVLEQLHPGEEDADGYEGFERVRPVAQVHKVRIAVRRFEDGGKLKKTKIKTTNFENLKTKIATIIL